MRRLGIPTPWLEDAYVLFDLFPGMITSAEDCVYKAPDQRIHLAIQQPGLNIVQHLKRGQERVDFCLCCNDSSAGSWQRGPDSGGLPKR